MSLASENIEQRLSSVEAGLVEVQQKLGIAPSAGNWVERVSGSLADIPEEDYQNFLDCCRAIRNGEPIPEAEGSPPDDADPWWDAERNRLRHAACDMLDSFGKEP